LISHYFCVKIEHSKNDKLLTMFREGHPGGQKGNFPFQACLKMTSIDNRLQKAFSNMVWGVSGLRLETWL